MGNKFDHDIWTLKKLAEGRDYTLHIAFWPQEDEKVLVKHVNRGLEPEAREKVEERLLKEASILEEFWSPYFPKIYDIRRKEDDQLYIISEFFPGTTLKDYLENSQQNINANFYRNLRDELSFALSYLHQRKKIIHLDLSPDNIIIDLENNIHLIDFENSKLKNQTWSQSDFRGKADYMAPELKQSDSVVIDEALDYFSLGSVLNLVFQQLSALEKLKLLGEKKGIKTLRSINPKKRSLYFEKKKTNKAGVSLSKSISLASLFFICCLSIFYFSGDNDKRAPQKTISKVIRRAPALPKQDRVVLKQAAIKREKKRKKIKSFNERFNETISRRDNELKECLSLFEHSKKSVLRVRYHFTSPPTKLDRIDFLSPQNLTSEAKVCISSVYKDPTLSYPAHKSKKAYSLIQSFKF